MNATIHVLLDDRTHVQINISAALLCIAHIRIAVLEGLILKVALTGFVANGTIQGVIDQEKFHDGFLVLFDAFGFGFHNHAFSGRSGTRRLEFRHFFDLDRAHATLGDHGHAWVPAEIRNFNSGFFSHLNQVLAGGEFNFPSVNTALRHVWLLECRLQNRV